MTDTARKPSTTARRAGYLVGALVDTVLLVLINVSPGWQAVPFLTGAAADVVPVVGIALAIALVVNLFCLVLPLRPLTALGDVLSTAAGLWVLLRTLDVFPFAFPESATDWATITRLALVSIIVVVCIALVVQVVVLMRALVLGPERG